MARFGAEFDFVGGFVVVPRVVSGMVFTCIHASEAAALSSDITGVFSLSPALEAFFCLLVFDFLVVVFAFALDGNFGSDGASFLSRLAGICNVVFGAGGGFACAASAVFEAAVPTVGFVTVFIAALVGILLFALVTPERYVDFPAVFNVLALLALAAALNPRVIVALTRLSKTWYRLRKCPLSR